MLTLTARRKPSTLWAIAFLWSVMFVLSLWSPPMTDNYLFSRNMAPGYAQFMAGAPIERLDPMTWQAAVEQAVTMYRSWCGRFLGNLLVYASFMLPPVLQAALSSAGFVVLCVLLHACIWGRQWRETLGGVALLSIAALLWAGMPSFGSAFFWVSVGGLPALMAQAAFLLPFRFSLDDGRARAMPHAWAACAAYFLLGAGTASLDYASSAAMPVAAAAGTAWLFFRQTAPRHAPRLHLAGLLGVGLGAALTLLAPGNACRMAITTDTDVHDWLARSLGDRVLDYCGHVPGALLMQGVPVLLLVWACWALRRCHGRGWMRRIPVAGIFFLIPAAATHGAYFFTPWPPERAFATTAMQLIVAASIIAHAARSALALRQRERTALRAHAVLRVMLCLYCAVSLPVELWKFHAVHAATEERDALYASRQGKDVRVPALSVRGDRHMVLGFHLQDIFYDPQHWVNRAVAANRGVASVALQEVDTRSLAARMTDVRGRPCVIAGQRRMEVLEVSVAVDGDRPAYEKLFFYYYGVPGLVHIFPSLLADAIAMRLDAPGAGLKTLLVPLCFARAEARLTWSKGPDGRFCGKGSAQLWGVYPVEAPIWVGRPGQTWMAADLHPLLPSAGLAGSPQNQ